MKDSLVDETGNRAALRLSQFVIVKLCCHQPLPDDSQGHPGGVTSNPSSAPLLCAAGRGTGATCWIKHQVARIRRHQDAALDDFGVGLDGVELLTGVESPSCIHPVIINRCNWKIIEI